MKGEHGGVQIRALAELFEIVEGRKEDSHYELLVQYIEVYNDQLRDLLAGNSFYPLIKTIHRCFYSFHYFYKQGSLKIFRHKGWILILFSLSLFYFAHIWQ